MDTAPHSHRGVAAALTATLGLCATSSIAANMSLTIAGIATPIQVLSFQVGATNSATLTTAGRPVFQDVTFTALESAVTPLQLQWLSTGQHQQTATLQVLAPPNMTKTSEWIFQDIAVTSVSVTSDPLSSGVDTPRVVFSLQYSRITYRVFAPNGGGAVQMCFDLKTLTRC